MVPGFAQPTSGADLMAFDQQITFLYTTDLERAAAFYGTVLGLELVLVQEAGCRIYRTGPAGFVGLCKPRDGRVPATDGLILCLVTEDVDGWAARLMAQGVELEKPPQRHADFDIYHCFLRDPDGYLLEIQRFETPNWPSG